MLRVAIHSASSRFVVLEATFSQSQAASPLNSIHSFTQEKTLPNVAKEELSTQVGQRVKKAI